nr:MAG TPA: hypothetical protein [Caudoviricetes sp.]
MIRLFILPLARRKKAYYFRPFYRFAGHKEQR